MQSHWTYFQLNFSVLSLHQFSRNNHLNTCVELLQSANLVDMMLPLSNLISTIQASYNFRCDKRNCHVYGPSKLHKLCILLLSIIIFTIKALTEVMVKVQTFDGH